MFHHYIPYCALLAWDAAQDTCALIDKLTTILHASEMAEDTAFVEFNKLFEFHYEYIFNYYDELQARMQLHSEQQLLRTTTKCPPY